MRKDTNPSLLTLSYSKRTAGRQFWSIQGAAEQASQVRVARNEWTSSALPGFPIIPQGTDHALEDWLA